MKHVAVLLQAVGLLVTPLAVGVLFGLWWGVLVFGVASAGAGVQLERELTA
jgi:hypothetical protein